MRVSPASEVLRLSLRDHLVIVFRLMWQIEKNFKVRIGGNQYINVQNIVEYEKQPLFTLKRHDDNGQLGIYFEIFDEKGSCIAHVKRNVIYPVTKNVTGGRYIVGGSRTNCNFIDTSDGSVICNIDRYEDAHPDELDVSVKLYTPGGFLFDATPTETNLRGLKMHDNVFSGVRTGISIAADGSIGIG